MSEPVVEERVQPHEAPTQQPQDVATAGVTGDTNAPPKEADAPTTTTGDATNLTPKLSPAELKKQAKAEKQARRAQAKTVDPAPKPQAGPTKEGQKQQRDSKQAPKDDKSRPLPTRRRPSQSNVPVVKEPEKKPKKEPKQAGLFFGHLYSQPKQQSMNGASKDVHPAILALGLQYSSYAICGSTARMVAMLLAFKAVIAEYQTPPGTSLARHLTNHHLSPQIEFLKSCRPLSVSMGNAIRHLKDSKFYIMMKLSSNSQFLCTVD
jgi:translation initiation factor eIF-2B subunit delta